MTPNNIDDWRRRIDILNDEILKLLSERANCALQIGRLKHASGQPIHVPERESAVLERLDASNPGPLSSDAILRLFRAIIDETRRLEQDDAARHRASGDGSP